MPTGDRPLRPDHVSPARLADIAADLGALPAAGSDAEQLAATAVTGVTLSSLGVVPGDLLAALPGANAHGATYAAGGVEAGAVAVLTDPAGAQIIGGAPVPVLVVDDPRSRLAEVAARVYGTATHRPRAVGITGTNGKTTCAYLVASALEALGRSTGVIGTIETRIGERRVRSVRTTPEAPDVHALLAVMAQEGIADCVMEVSSHALTLHRVDGIVFDVALFTNLSQDHLDFHGSMEEYFAAKASLFTPARSHRGVVCVDDEWGRRLATTASVSVTTVATVDGVDADWRARPTDDEGGFVLEGAGTALDLRSGLPGDFNVANTALAAVALHVLGTPIDAIAPAILVPPVVPGRMERVTTSVDDDDLPEVVVDFAHTPDAVASALAALRPRARGDLVCVLGAGGDRDRGKRPGMGAAGAAGADVLVVTDDNPRSEDPAAIRAAVLDGARSVEDGAEIVEIADRAEAVRTAVLDLGRRRAGSVVVVLGKGHETGQEVAGVVHDHDDRTVARSALEEATA